MSITKLYLKDLTYKVTGAAIEVHKQLGPSLLESVYHKCMKIELQQRETNFKSEFVIPIIYKGIAIKDNLRCDLLIEDTLIVELKSVKDIIPVHKAQLLTYMSLLNIPKGLLINFNVSNLYREGQVTYVNEIFRELND